MEFPKTRAEFVAELGEYHGSGGRWVGGLWIEFGVGG